MAYLVTMAPVTEGKGGGIYQAASELSILKVNVMEAEKWYKRKDLSDFDKGSKM